MPARGDAFALGEFRRPLKPARFINRHPFTSGGGKLNRRRRSHLTVPHPTPYLFNWEWVLGGEYPVAAFD